MLLLHISPNFKISETVYEAKYPPSAYLWMAGGFPCSSLQAGKDVGFRESGLDGGTQLREQNDFGCAVRLEQALCSAQVNELRLQIKSYSGRVH